MLDNAFLLWERYAESNRRFVEERAEQLKSFANLAALLAGFAIVSFLQACREPPCFLSLRCHTVSRRMSVMSWLRAEFGIGVAQLSGHR